MSDLYRITYGDGLSLPEWKKWAEGNEMYFIEIKDVKTFKFGNNFAMKNEVTENITTLIIRKNSDWIPKYGSGWSGEKRGYDLYSYNLTDDEIIEILNEYEDFHNGNIILTNKDGWQKIEEITDINVIYTEDFRNKISEKATEKFKKKDHNKTYTFFINNIEFEYTAHCKERINEKTESLMYSFYFFDKNDKMIKYSNVPGIYG